MKFINKKALFLTALFLFACSAETASNLETRGKQVTLAELQQEWTLTAIDGEPLDSKIISTLTLAPEGKATGNLACNHFFGTLQLQNNQLRIDKMASTRKMCRDQVNTAEAIVSATLSGWSEFSLNATQLTLRGQAHSLSYKIKQ